MATGKLAEIERAAIRIQTKRFNDFFEEQEYQSKLKGHKLPTVNDDENPAPGTGRNYESALEKESKQ